MQFRDALQTVAPRIRAFDPDSVTTISEREVEPQSVGLDPEKLAAIWQSVVSFYKLGMHPSLSLCLRYRGEVVLDRSIGHSRGNGTEEDGCEPILATPDTLYNLFSASKAVTAMLIHLLDDRGLVHLDDAVAEYIPEFAQHGKQSITLRHVLTHRAGVAELPIDGGGQATLDLLTDWDRIIEALCTAKPSTMPGRRLAYHAVTGGYLLGEVIRRVTGSSIQEFLRKEVAGPMGFENFRYGVPADKLSQVAVETLTGTKPVFPLTWIVRRALGADLQSVIDIANDPQFLTAVVPAGNIIATTNEVCLFFELLLRGGELNGTRIFEERTIRRAVAEQNYLELDTTLMLPLRYGMGFMLGANYLSFYGMHSAQAFGHLGFSNILAYADPERDISVALMNNGKPLLTPEALSWLNIPWLIARSFPRQKR